MVDFLDEVKEDLKREHYTALFNRYKYHAAAALICIISGTALFNWYGDYALQQQQDTGETYRQAILALNKNDTKEALPLLDQVMDNGTSGYRELAGLRKAATLIKNGETDKALAIYNKIIANSTVDQNVRDLANLLATELLIEKDSKMETIEKRLALLTRPDKVWRFSALEMQGYYKLDKGDNTSAITIFKSLESNPLAPSSMRQRANSVLSMLSPSQQEME